MEAMRQSWTDDRLDDFRGEVNRRFEEVDRRFEEVDRRFDEVDRRFDKVDAELHRVNDRLDGLHRLLAHAIVAMTAGILTGNAVLVALIVTQL